MAKHEQPRHRDELAANRVGGEAERLQSHGAEKRLAPRLTEHAEDRKASVVDSQGRDADVVLHSPAIGESERSPLELRDSERFQ